MTLPLRKQLLELGLDLTQLKPAYDKEVVVRGIRLSAAAIYPGQPEPEALRQMGRLFMRGFSETLMGRALVQFMKVIGPRRSMQRMERNFATGGNYIQTRFTSLGVGKAEVWFNDVSGIPEFYAGIIQRGGEFSGAKDLQVTFAPVVDTECTFVVTWTE